MPSISSCSISASPKRKNDLCRFLSCGQRVLHATITNRSFHSIISVQEVNYQLVLEVGWYKLWLWLAQECIFSENKILTMLIVWQLLDTSHGNGNVTQKQPSLFNTIFNFCFLVHLLLKFANLFTIKLSIIGSSKWFIFPQLVKFYNGSFLLESLINSD